MKTQFKNHQITSGLWLTLFTLILAVSVCHSQTQISCGQTITSSISTPTAIDQYTYNGSAGQTVTLAFVGNGNCFNDGQIAVMDLYNPSGQKIATLNHCGSRSINLTLATSGTYTILVHDDDYAQTSSYALSIQSFTGGGCSTTAISCGQTVSNNISRKTEVDAYSYVGSAGQTLTFAFVGNGNCFNDGQTAVMDLYNPSGQKIATLNHCGSRSINLTLAASGTYTILVHDDDYEQTSTYALSIQSFTGGGCSTTPIVSGQTVNRNISRSAEIDAFGLGTSPGTLIVSFVGNGNCFNDGQNVVMELYNPGGQKIASLSHCGLRSTNLTLTASGTYTFLVHDDDYAQSSSYSLTTTFIGACNYSITPTSASVGGAATNSTVAVAAQAGCAWTSTANVSWLTITNGATGSGNGTVSYLVDANPSTNARAGTMTIAGWTFIVNQAGAATFVGHDIGDPGALGSFSSSNGVFTVIGSGEDIEDTADAFHFVHQPVFGNCQIVARVLNLQGPNPQEGEAGIMIRESLNAGSKSIFLGLNTSTNIVFRRRLATDAPSAGNTFSVTNRPWLRLMRMGNTLVAHCSPDGVNWEYVWFTTLTTSNKVEVGLAVTAHHNGLLATARLDSVSLAPLSPLPGTWPLPGPQLFLGGEPEGSIEFQRQGGFRMLVGGVVGDRFSIRTSPDIDTPIASWSLLGTVTNTFGVVPFLDSTAPAGVRKFYRAEKVDP